MSKIEIFSEKINHADNVINIEFEVRSKNGAEIGIGNVRVKSIKKETPKKEVVVPPVNGNNDTKGNSSEKVPGNNSQKQP